MNIKLFLLLFFIPLLIGCGENVAVVKDDASKEEAPIELQMTKQEEAEFAKWKNRSMDDATFDALKCDRGALYLQGLCILTGHGWAIDTELADTFFSKSASFGFAPALDQIRLTACDNNMLFIAMIYLNLIISEGHQEFVLLYHKLRSNLTSFSEAGQKIAKEIEWLAIRKKASIRKNNDALKRCSCEDDKSKLFITMNDISDEDLVFDDAYWEQVANGTKPSDSEIYGLMLERKHQKLKADRKRLEAHSLDK